MNSPKVAFIGAGNMATAIIAGMIKQGVDPQSVCATRRNQQKLKALHDAYGVVVSYNNHEAIAWADVVVLAVKPQMMKDVLTDLAEDLHCKQPLLISVAVGIPCLSMEQWIGARLPIVRAMPNTPSLLQAGASGLYAEDSVSNEQKALAKNILSAAGIVLWVDKEADLDAVAALSGGGPAYYFLFVEAMMKAGEALGLDAEDAKVLALQTFQGAALMVGQEGADAALLRKQVCSPGGTTEQAIASFQSAHIDSVVEEALRAAVQRARELAMRLS